jgi:CTP synthase
MATLSISILKKTLELFFQVIAKERRGDYLRGTIQVIPHVTNEIKRRIGLVDKESRAEVVIVEVGGTVGDITLVG